MSYQHKCICYGCNEIVLLKDYRDDRTCPNCGSKDTCVLEIVEIEQCPEVKARIKKRMAEVREQIVVLGKAILEDREGEIMTSLHIPVKRCCKCNQEMNIKAVRHSTCGVLHTYWEIVHECTNCNYSYYVGISIS